MKYCKNCVLAGDIAYTYIDKIGCIACSGDLEDKDYAWIKSKEIKICSGPLLKEMEEPYP